MIASTNKLAGFVFLALLFALISARSAKAEPGRMMLHGHVPAAVAGLVPKGRLSATNHLCLAIGLPLRNEAALNELLRQLYDPHSTNFHKFLAPPEFTARFGPTEQEYQAVIKFAEANGLTVAGTHPNRMVLDVEGSASNVEQAFHVTFRTYKHPTEARDFFAPVTEPSAPTNLSVVTVEGLSDYGLPKPLSHKADALKVRPLSFNGSGPNSEYAGNDFRNAYVPGTKLNGAGQSVGLLEFSDYYPVDITNYENTIGLANYIPLTNVVLSGGTPSTDKNYEVALDIELTIAMAPGLSRVIVYEEKSINPSSILNRMANDNLAKQLSSSWSWSGGPSTTIDSIFQQMAAQGQSFFQASGDHDAYTGNQTLDNSSQTTAPVDSTNLTCVGGTTLTMNGAGASWSSETVWNYNLRGITNEGSGGGISAYYSIPSWQTNVNMATNQGSTTNRNIPDVALTADNIFVSYNNGDDSGTYYFIGTSCAAPLWAGFCALVNQQSVADNPTNFVGFLNPALYNIASGTNYNACFHDITTGNNIGTNTAGLFNAVAGYDLCTGLGTPNGTNLINALAPLSLPFFITQPFSQTVTNSTSVTFSTTVAGQSPLICQWQFNGTNLPTGGNISGTTSNVLSITAATTNNSGNYSLIVTNSYGSVTSSVAVLNVGFTPAFSAQPTNLTILSGSNVVFSATASGSAPLVYQWRKNGTNLVNGTGISGATSDVLTLTAVTTNSGGNYNLSVTNSFGAITSSVATLTVVLPPTITSSTLTNRTVQCGSNNVTFAITVSGTPPLSIRWSLDGSPVTGATNTSFSLTNLHLPNHTVTVTVTVTNLYGSATSNAVVTVLDTLAPVITLNGGNPVYVELGSTFADPGATATDTCAGVVTVSVGGSVNTNAPGTNTVIYTATDGEGNTNTATRTVIVRDTTPPTILWSFTHLTLDADTNCSAPMPDVTGTNYLLATDLSGTLTISQAPTNAAVLLLGTNVVVITIKDSSGNAAYSTNTVVVQDQTPPGILSQPQSQTNTVGATASFTVAATACTPLVFQWYFNDSALAAQTNSTLTLSNLTLASAGNYFVVVAAAGGSSTSAVVTLAVVLPPAITSSSLTNQTVECGSNNVTFAVTASGTPPLSIQWSLDGSPVTGATNTSFSLTNLHLPNHTVTVTVTVTNLYGSATSNAVVTVLDTLAPVITLNGGNPVYVELGSTFADPGATATDTCAGVVTVSVGGSVNTNAPGTNTVIYTATDGEGNTNTATRTVIVRDTTPPTILWSFTHLTLDADTNCSAPMPDVTGTNYLLATDLSGTLTISQAPTNAAVLLLGTNVVVITIKDSSGNAAYSTNTVVVQDQTPPGILSQPQSQTNTVGATASFTVAATACTPLVFQWYFNDSALAAQTNSTLTLSNLTLASAGNYFVVVAAAGGSSTSAVVTLTVDLLSSTVALAASANPSGFKDSLNFTAGVTPTNATSTIQFFTNGVIFDTEPVVVGAAVSTNISSLLRGTNFITAVYSGDASYLSATNTLAQIVTNHPPAAAAAFYTRAAGLPLTIAVTDLATNWSDADGDSISLAAVSASTNGITLTNNGVALVYFNSNNVADQFTCTISDGWGGTNFQTVNIAVAFPGIAGVAANPDGSFTLNLTVVPGYTCILETTTDLISSVNWLPVATNTPGIDSVWQFNDAQATNFQQRFYRFKLVP